MSIYTSLTLSRTKAMDIVLRKLTNISNEDLKELASTILREGERYNIYRVVADGEPNDDDKV